MPDRKSRARDGESSKPDDAVAGPTPSAEGEPLPPAGAESEPESVAAVDPAEPVAAETVTVDAEGAALATPVHAENAAPTAPVEDTPRPAPDEAGELQHEEEEGWSFAARALALLLALIAGAVIGIWGAPRLAAHLPAGMAPVADWLAPGQSAAEAEIAGLRQRLDDRLGGVEARLAELAAPDDIDARIAAAAQTTEARLTSEIAPLKEAVAEVTGSDPADALARLQSALQGQANELASLKEQLSGAAATSGQLTEEAVQKIDVYRAELDGLRGQVGDLQGKVGTLGSRLDEVAAAASRQIEAAQARVGQIQTQADTALSAAATQSDIALIRAAVASGQPFAAPLKALSERPGLALPQGLDAAAASGVETMAELRDRFPDAAHAAIQGNIMAAAGDGVMARSRAFLEAQVASRSLSPQPGQGTDAVLSRMEDRLRQDDLDGALAEAEQLPSEAAAAMADWLAAARLRVAAIAGLATLEAAAPATN